MVSAVDCRFEPRSGLSKYHKIDICYLSNKNAALRSKIEDWFGSKSGCVKVEQHVDPSFIDIAEKFLL